MAHPPFDDFFFDIWLCVPSPPQKKQPTSAVTAVVNKIDELLDQHVGIKDQELSTTIYDLAKAADGPEAFANKLDEELADFEFPDDFVLDVSFPFASVGGRGKGRCVCVSSCLSVCVRARVSVSVCVFFWGGVGFGETNLAALSLDPLTNTLVRALRFVRSRRLRPCPSRATPLLLFARCCLHFLRAPATTTTPWLLVFDALLRHNFVGVARFVCVCVCVCVCPPSLLLPLCSCSAFGWAVFVLHLC